MYKPLYLEEGRAILKINKIPRKDALEGEIEYDLDKVGTVQSCTLKDLKKGTVVVPIIRGGVPIHEEETKKFIVISIDVEDLYAQKV